MNPPSRWSNPFATCWTRPDVLPHLEMAGQGVDDLLVRWEETAWRGQVIGPHGSGKSSLLMEVARRLPEWEREPLWVTINTDNFREAASQIRQAANHRTVVFLEGFERASRWHQHRLLAACARKECGWLLTTHEKLQCKRTLVVAQVHPTVETALHLYEFLTEQRTSPVTRADVARSFGAQDGNLREVWFDLYEQHEMLTYHRTAPVAVTYG